MSSVSERSDDRSEQSDHDSSHSAPVRSHSASPSHSAVSDSHSASDNEGSRKVKRKNKGKKRKRRISSSSESSSDDRRREARRKRKRSRKAQVTDDEELDKMFDPTEGDTEVHLEPHLKKFVDKYFKTFLSEEKMARVLEDLNLPELDALQVPKLDEEFQDLIRDDRKADSMLKNDKNLAKVQAALMRAMAPLVKIWSEIDMMKRVEEYRADLSIDDMATLFEKLVIALGQMNVAINFNRRWPIMAADIGKREECATYVGGQRGSA